MYAANEYLELHIRLKKWRLKQRGGINTWTGLYFGHLEIFKLAFSTPLLLLMVSNNYFWTTSRSCDPYDLPLLEEALNYPIYKMGHSKALQASGDGSSVF